MTKKTEMIINKIIAENGFDNLIKLRDFDEFQKKYDLTFDTFRKYVNFEVVEKTERTYYTIEDLVEMLNDCADSDCWGCYWHYEVDKEGRAYSDYTWMLGIKLKGLK